MADVSRSRAALAAAVSLARTYGLRVDDPAVLADGFSLMVHLRPAPVVARVSTWVPKLRAPIADWLAREVAMTAHLVGLGAPVVAPSREVPAGPHEHDGFAISFWTYLEPDPGRTPTMADCAAMLPELHRAMASFPGELPLLAPAANEVPRGLAALDAADDLLSPAERALLIDTAERLRPLWMREDGDCVPLHGDVHPGNLIATRGGLVWIDFEETCRGPVEWDLALLHWSDPAAVARHFAPDPSRLRDCGDLRALHLALCLIAFRDDLGDGPEWDAGIRGFLGLIRSSD